MINRTLILQQAKLQPGQQIKAVDVTQQIDMLRKEIPECKQAKCETEEGWNAFLARQGFTAAELQERWKQRMEVLQYIENRFRMGIRISPDEIKDYYQKKMLPEYAKRKATPPKLEDISARIQEILLQQRVSKLLQDWLKSLKAQGTLEIMKAGRGGALSEDRVTRAEETELPEKKRKKFHLGHAAMWTIGSVLLLVLLTLAGAAWYTTTEDFQKRVGKEVVSILEDSTGGKVDLAKITFNLWHLAIEANGLVIHGLEGPGEAPYLSADRILVRVKIISFLAHTTGAGVASHIGLSLLRVEQPHVHLIIDKDGKTNQPVPKHPSTSTTPLQDTLLDLKAADVELVNGMAVFERPGYPVRSCGA